MTTNSSAIHSNCSSQRDSHLAQTSDLKTISLQLHNRLKELSTGLDNDFLNIELILRKSKMAFSKDISLSEANDLVAETSAYMSTTHPNYGILAGRVLVSNLHAKTETSFSKTIKQIYELGGDQNDYSSLVSQEVYDIVMNNAEAIDREIEHSRDFDLDFFAFKTLEKSYLLRFNKRILERPQHMLMRVSIGIHKDDLKKAFQTYHYMSERWFIHATPTLCNSGTQRPQMSSCFLLTVKEDSIEGIYDTLKQCALISKYGGGIGLAISNIRASGSLIKGTGGASKGLIPFVKLFNDTARYVDQGGKRKGAITLYLEPWHADILDFLHFKRNQGPEENRARDLFYALWVPDLFMQRVLNDQDWTLMCPSECPGLWDCWGEEFNKLYTKYEEESRGRRVMKARKLWEEIVQSQTETGGPFIVYKDTVNRKSNQKNLGTIKCSNLCTEIMEYSSGEQVAICNLGSISLPKFVNRETRSFDFKKLAEITYFLTENLNKVIDQSFYPVPEGKYSNSMHRPIGIGVQGVADALILMRIPYDSDKALEIDQKIFETIYHSALKASNNLAKQFGPYKSFAGSPASQGILQFDLWNVVPSSDLPWDELKGSIKQFGLRNSLLIALMPTASTSQILGNNESFEPYTTNLYMRRVLAGEFMCVNPHLIKDLIQRGLWTYEIRNKLIADGGSVQRIPEISDELKELYKTVWEIPQKTILKRAIARGPYIDQSQSLNIYMKEPTYSKLCSMHFYAWKGGLKTGMYYLRTRPVADAIQFTVDLEALQKMKSEPSKNRENKETLVSLREKRDDKKDLEEKSVDLEICFSCGS